MAQRYEPTTARQDSASPHRAKAQRTEQTQDFGQPQKVLGRLGVQARYLNRNDRHQQHQQHHQRRGGVTSAVPEGGGGVQSLCPILARPRPQARAYNVKILENLGNENALTTPCNGVFAL